MSSRLLAAPAAWRNGPALGPAPSATGSIAIKFRLAGISECIGMRSRVGMKLIPPFLMTGSGLDRKRQRNRPRNRRARLKPSAIRLKRFSGVEIVKGRMSLGRDYGCGSPGRQPVVSQLIRPVDAVFKSRCVSFRVARPGGRQVRGMKGCDPLRGQEANRKPPTQCAGLIAGQTASSPRLLALLAFPRHPWIAALSSVPRLFFDLGIDGISLGIVGTCNCAGICVPR